MLESFEFKALQADDTHHTFKASRVELITRHATPKTVTQKVKNRMQSNIYTDTNTNTQQTHSRMQSHTHRNTVGTQ